MMKVSKVLLIVFVIAFFVSCSQVKKINSGTMQVKHNSSTGSFGGNLYENKRTWRDISASIRKIHHYTQRKDWDLRFKISPSLHLDSMRFQTQATRQLPNGQRATLPELDYTRLAMLGNFKLYTDTPFGQLSYTLGMGPGVYHLTDGEALDTVRLRSVIKMDLAYSFFVTKRIFVLVGPRIYFEEGVEIIQQAFRIGYFWEADAS